VAVVEQRRASRTSRKVVVSTIIHISPNYNLPKHTMQTLPRVHRALIASGPGKFKLNTTQPLPPFAPNQVLVKVHAVALNPSDHKFVELSTVVGAVSGADFSGTVVAVGLDCIKPLALGTRVCSCVFGSNSLKPGNGAFAEYVAIRSELCILVPARISLEAAASMPVALITAAYVVRSLRLPSLPELGKRIVADSARGRFVLVNGGATATGTILMQVLSQIGCLPIATCSPRNAALVMKYGARKVFDYASPTCAKDIRVYTKDRLDCVLDCIGSAITMGMCYQAMGSKGGRYTALEPYNDRIKATRPDIKADWILAWTVYGERVALDGVYERPPILVSLVEFRGVKGFSD
jgi:aspyridone synthetase trans-acting enoyl reductase